MPFFEGAFTFYLKSEKNYSYAEYKNAFLNDTLILYIERDSFFLKGISFNQPKRLFEK